MRLTCKGSVSISTIFTVAGSAPATTVLSIASRQISFRSAAGLFASVDFTVSTTALTRAMAAPIALATSDHLGFRTLLAPLSSSGAMTAPPPTSNTGRSSGDVFIVSMTFSSFFLMTALDCTSSSCVSAPLTSSGLPIARLGSARTVQSVVVRTLPPKTRASLVSL